MSSVGQAIGGLIGAVAGFFLGGGPAGALKGFSIGASIGGMLDPPKGPNQTGPRLTDLSVQTSTYGTAIPRIYGTIATLGNIFWLQGDRLTEVATVSKQKSGGKGGGGKSTVTTYSYFATFAVGLCQGEIAGVRRIWVGSNLIYDAGSDDVSTIAASNQIATGFKIYFGSETQTPDQRMQADKGVDNTPAYRGLAYIVFYDFALKDYGNSLLGAQVKVEVVKDGANASQITTTTTTAPFHTVYGEQQEFFRGRIWLVGGIDPTIGGARTSVLPCSADGKTFIQHPTNWPRGYEGACIEFKDSLFYIGGDRYDESGNLVNNGVLQSVDGYNWTVVADSTIFGTHGRFSAAVVEYDGKLWLSGGRNAVITYFNDVWNSEDGINWYLVTSNGGFPVRSAHKMLSYDGKMWILGGQPGSPAGVWNSTDGITWTKITDTPAFSGAGSLYGHASVVFQEKMWVIGGSYGGGGWTNKCYTSTDGDAWIEEIISPTFPVAAHISAVVAWDTLFIHHGNSDTYYFYSAPISSGTTTLDNILSAECLSSGLLEGTDLDVIAIDSDVRGYRVAETGAIRAALEPLQGAFPFDVIPKGYKIAFVPRGGASVKTIADTMLDARAAGAAPGVALTTSREMDSQLPRRVSIKYFDNTREYDISEQYAERLNTDAVNVLDSTLPIVLNATEAAGVAEKLLYLYWLDRYNLNFTLPPEYFDLEPGDVITLTGDDYTYEIRLTEINYTSGGWLECRGRFNNSAVYTAAAVGEEGSSTGKGVVFAGPSLYVLLDIPCLQDVFNATGFPAAMCGFTTTWPGGVIFRSNDDGQTWADLQGFTGSVPIGFAMSALPTGRTDIIDTTNVLGVTLLAGELVSVTESQLLNGSNYFAIGAHDRWEIVAAKNCTLQLDGSYILSDLLRGRFGTEWAMSTHAIGDAVVLLTDSDMAWIGMDSASIGLTRQYRGITSGAAIDSDVSLYFTYSGVNLECLSPVYLNGNRHPSTNDWTLTWVRRTRIDGALRNYVDVSLGETAESYEIDIYSDGTYATVKRTITASSATAAYTSAQQTTDFGGNQTTLYVKVYQLSATVGRGYPLTATITR